MATTTVKDVINRMVGTARGRNVKWMDSTILLHALCYLPGNEAHRILYSAGELEPEDTAAYMTRFDNEPLEDGGTPKFTPKVLRIVSDARSPLDLLRAIQHTDCTANQLLKERGLLPPEHEPTGEQVERAAETGYFLSARSYFSYGNLKAWEKVKQASKEKWREWARLMLEAVINDEDKEEED